MLTSDGIELGDVLDVELDLEGWRVSWLVIRLHRDVTDRFHVDVPFVMGTKAIALAPLHVKAAAPHVQLRGTLADTVVQAVVSFDTDATDHVGRGR